MLTGENCSVSPWLRSSLHPWANVRLGTSLQGAGWSRWMLLLYGSEESRWGSPQMILGRPCPEGSRCAGGWLLEEPRTWSTCHQHKMGSLLGPNILMNNRGICWIFKFIHSSSWKREPRRHLGKCEKIQIQTINYHILFQRHNRAHVPSQHHQDTEVSPEMPSIISHITYQYDKYRQAKLEKLNAADALTAVPAICRSCRYTSWRHSV